MQSAFRKPSFMSCQQLDKLRVKKDLDVALAENLQEAGHIYLNCPKSNACFYVMTEEQSHLTRIESMFN